MKDKLRLDYFLSVGGELAKDDGCYNVENEEPNEFIGVVGNDKEYPGYFEFGGKGYGIYSEEDLKQLVITSFAERENKGAQPVADGDFPVDAKLRCGESRNEKAIYLTWSTASHEGDIITWKPDYEALLKMQAEHDKHNESIIKACDEANKKESEMVYTQEMKDNGELPVVGMKCLDSKGNEVVFLGEHKGEAWLESVSNTIDWNTHCDAVKNLKPLKTPEQIELEEAKKKQLEDMCFKYKNLPLEVAMQMQKNGDFPKIVLDDSNARGMAKG